MSPKVNLVESPRHQVLPEKAPHMIKARLRNPENALDYRPLIGEAIQCAVRALKLSNKQAAAAIGVDDSQFGKWISGTETPQFAKLWAFDPLRKPLVIALAQLCEDDGIQIRTVITVEAAR